MGLVLGGSVVFVVLVGCYLYDVWRRPDKACRWCGGRGQILGSSMFLNRLVGGNCLVCRGQPWRMRRVARWFGWNRHSKYWR